MRQDDIRRRLPADPVSARAVVADASSLANASDSSFLQPRTAEEAAREWTPADFCVEGMLARGYLYSWTGQPGHGKTTLAATLAVCFANGLNFLGRKAGPGKVLILSGENDHDTTARLMAAAQHHGVPLGSNIVTLPLAFALSDHLEDLIACLQPYGDFGLVIVDTSAVYFGGADENSNQDMQAHALALRALTSLPGTPVVVVLCHPGKSSVANEPRGASSFLGAIDGNFSCVMTDSKILMKTTKYRHDAFEPLGVVLRRVELTGRWDNRGRPATSVVAELDPAFEPPAIEGDTSASELEVLAALADSTEPMSQAQLLECLTADMPQSTFGKFMQILERRSWVTKNGRRQGYELGAMGRVQHAHATETARRREHLQRGNARRDPRGTS